MPRFVMSRTIFALVMRQMTTTNVRSPGGVLWAILSPVGAIVVLSLIVTMIGLRTPALGTNFPIFFATGVLPFLMAMHVSGSVGGAIANSRQLLTYPRVTFLDAILARFLFSALVDLVVFYVVITFILLTFETRTMLDFPQVLLSVSMAFALGFGIGSVNCLLQAIFPVYQSLWGIFMGRPLFLASGIIFIPENVPHPYSEWMLWNPFIHITGCMRRAFYFSYDATWVSPVYVFSISAVLTLIGLLFLRRYYRDLLER